MTIAKPAIRLRAFTLPELMVAATIAAFAMAAILSGFVFLARNFTRLANRHALEAQSRRALTYLQNDLAQAAAVVAAPGPSATQLKLTLPAGSVTYTYDATSLRLRRQASFGTVTDLDLLFATGCQCSAFAFNYFTGAGGAPTDQLAPAVTVPFSVKQVQVSFVLETPASDSPQTRTSWSVVSPRYLLRNKRSQNGS